MKIMYNTGCIICGSELVYMGNDLDLSCIICSKHFRSNVKCKEGHFICDECHRSSAIDYTENYCLNNFDSDASVSLIEILNNPAIKMHGPEHHFIVPAVLLTSYYNIRNEHDLLVDKLKIAKTRSKNVPGGLCGSCGNCGAAVGTGIFMSIITENTPVSKDSWRLSNLMTSRSLEAIANNGGPRCCKRDSFLAIETASLFVKENMNLLIPVSEIKCSFHSMNKECKMNECKYY